MESEKLFYNINYTTLPLNNWFVLQVKTKKELFIKDYITKHSIIPVKMLIFSRELIFKRNGRYFKIFDILFPGYIFVYKNVHQVLELMKNNLRNEFIKPICFKERKCLHCFTEDSLCMVKRHEMRFLLSNSDCNGVFRLSEGFLFRNNVYIYNGPLKDLKYNILWINEKKRKACVEIQLFQRKININLGIDITRRKDYYRMYKSLVIQNKS